MDKKMNIEEWRQYLKIDRNNLDEELERQPELYEVVGDAYVEAVDRRDSLELEMNTLYAVLLIKAKEAKLTDPQSKAKVESDPEYQHTYLKWLDAKKQAAKWANLKDAFASRADMLKELCKLHAQNYFQRNAVKGPTTKNLQYEQARLELAKKRRATI